MMMRSLPFMFLLFMTFPCHAQEGAAALNVDEISQGSKAIEQSPPATVEVGRHVMGNVDAGTMIVSLLLVLVAIIAAAWLLKKLQVGGSVTNHLKVVSSLNLGTKERLVVVQVGEKQLLLGVTGQQINLLDTLDEHLEIKSGVPIELSQTLARFSTNFADKGKSEKYS